MANQVAKWVVEHIIKEIEKGERILPWQKPWATIRPMNMITRKPYRGCNIMLLSYSNFSSPYWLSLKQVLSLKGRVRKEEFANKRMVTYWQIGKYRLVNGRREYLPNDAPFCDGKSFMLRYYYVYNVEQTEGIPENKIPVLDVKKVDIDSPESIERAQAFWDNYLALANNGLEVIDSNKAAYYPTKDKIAMPKRELFENDSSFFATLFHEGAHSTGHHTRLSRIKPEDHMSFGSEPYAKEELIAEFASAMACATTGITNVVDNSISYIDNWIKVLKNDPNILISGASLGEKAFSYMSGEEVIDYEKEEEAVTV